MTAAIGSFDDEDLRALQGFGGINSPSNSPLLEPPSVPCGISSASSITQASKTKPVPIHRPAIEEPQVNIMIPLMALSEKMGDSRNRQLDIQSEEHITFRSNIDQLELKVQTEMDQMKKESNSRGTWDTLFTISQYLISAGAIVVGATMVGLPAALLIASGVIGIGNRVLQDTNLLKSAVEWYTKSAELQRKITQNIEMGAFILQMGLGLAGGFAAGIGAEYARNIALGLNLFGAGAKVGSEYYKKRLADINSDLTKTRYQITSNNEAISQSTRDAAKLLEAPEIELMKNAIRDQAVSID
jgi:hypothetical protein